MNGNYKKLSPNYLFSEMSHRIEAFSNAHPEKRLIRMGIGDVTRPLCPTVIQAMNRAVNEMGNASTFRGYGPEQGYEFLRSKIQDYYLRRHIHLDMDEIFISDGAKSDLGNILDLFTSDNSVLIPDPVYPVYQDTNVMDDRKILYVHANEKNGFLPMPDEAPDADILYLCSPNNPTGAVYHKAQLQKWIHYACSHGAFILFDAAYEAFLTDPEFPHSIFEIPGARECAIEFCSLSKTAGFTGTRCGYTIVPNTLKMGDFRLNSMWLRRQTTKFNGVSYIVQRGAEAVFTEDGQREIAENIAYYHRNAHVIMEALDRLGIWYTGGKNSPYIWLKCPIGHKSWDFFDLLLTQAGVIGTPGIGFGQGGEGYFRLTAFSDYESTQEAMERICHVISHA